jgi:hypothetical protein
MSCGHLVSACHFHSGARRVMKYMRWVEWGLRSSSMPRHCCGSVMYGNYVVLVSFEESIVFESEYAGLLRWS